MHLNPAVPAKPTVAGGHPSAAFWPSDSLPRSELFGLDFVDAPDLRPVVNAILAHAPAVMGPERPDGSSKGSVAAVVTPNVDILVSLDCDPPPGVVDLFRAARFVLPDGMPVVVTSKLLGRPLTARLTGSGLFRELWPRLAADRRRVVVLCSNDEIAARLGDEHPDAAFVVPPYFQVGDSIHLAVVAKELQEAVERVSAEYVLLGVGHPKDALLVNALLEGCEEAGIDAPLCLCLGGSFALYIGQQRRAPDLVQRIGMEWLFRFAQEPRRLFKRYFVDDLAFVGLVRREWLHRRRSSAS